MICVDVWGGYASQDLVARYLLPMSEAIVLARSELDAGYLINMRKEMAWGKEENFDSRLNAV